MPDTAAYDPMNPQAPGRELPPVARALDAAGRSGLFDPEREVRIARAPGRLDVMGGIADYSGSRVCELPLAVGAAAVVQGRRDGKIVCRSRQTGRVVALPMAPLRASPAEGVRSLLAADDAWARYVIGCVWRLVGPEDGRTGMPPRAETDAARLGGVTVLIDSDVPVGGGVSSSAAVEVATMMALCGLWEARATPMQIAAACQEVENRVVGAPCGVMDQVTSCLGVAGSMLEILCQPDAATGMPAQVLGSVAIPPGVRLIGLYSGVSHEVRGDPYTDSRVAAFMGQRMLESLATGEGEDPTHGCLARVDAEAFALTLAWELPERMSGAEFLQRFGGTHDPVTTVRPEKVYAVRAATRHHVEEMRRVSLFVGLLKGEVDGHRSWRTRLVRAGALMVGSHHSYGINAGLGHPLTDRLVELVRERSVAEGLYGAKITGGGSGGTVAVMAAEGERATAAIAAVRERYESQSGRRTLLLEGTSPGAAAVGVMRARV